MIANNPQFPPPKPRPPFPPIKPNIGTIDPVKPRGYYDKSKSDFNKKEAVDQAKMRASDQNKKMLDKGGPGNSTGPNPGKKTAPMPMTPKIIGKNMPPVMKKGDSKGIGYGY